MLFFFLKLNGCTESFLSSSLGKHLSLTFVRVTDTHQDKAAVHSHLPVSKRIIHSPQTYSWARKCANAILNPEATAKAKKKQQKKNKPPNPADFLMTAYPKQLILCIIHHGFKSTITTARTIL